MRISLEGVRQFANWSGDRNPLHVDEGFARRTFFGRSIAHGMLSVLRTLGSVRLAGAPRPQTLDIEFRGSVAPGADYAVETSQQGETLSVELHDGGRSVLIVRVSSHLETAKSAVADTSWTTAVRRDASFRVYP